MRFPALRFSVTPFGFSLILLPFHFCHPLQTLSAPQECRGAPCRRWLLGWGYRGGEEKRFCVLPALLVLLWVRGALRDHQLLLFGSSPSPSPPQPYFSPCCPSADHSWSVGWLHLWICIGCSPRTELGEQSASTNPAAAAGCACRALWWAWARWGNPCSFLCCLSPPPAAANGHC